MDLDPHCEATEQHGLVNRAARTPNGVVAGQHEVCWRIRDGEDEAEMKLAPALQCDVMDDVPNTYGRFDIALALRGDFVYGWRPDTGILPRTS